MSRSAHVVALVVPGLLVAAGVITVVIRYARHPSHRRRFRDAFRDRRAVAIGALVGVVLFAVALADRGDLMSAAVPALAIGATVAAVLGKVRRPDGHAPDVERQL